MRLSIRHSLAVLLIAATACASGGTSAGGSSTSTSRNLITEAELPTSGTETAFDLFAVIGKAVRIVGNSTGSVADLSEAVRAIAANRIVPVVDRRFGIGETAAAYAELAAGSRHFGKLVIEH